MLEKEIEARYREWLAADWLSEEDRAELAALTDEAEISDRFYCEAEFGTGGVRGELGVGSNRMNIYLIRRLTQALADAVLEQGGAERGVAISYDSRRFSPEFAEEAALVLAANGVRAYLFSELHPTPMLSYAVRRLSAMAGIMITASHNPKQYNGYKVYWEDGGQLPPEQADRIIAKMAERDIKEIVAMPRAEAEAAGLLRLIGSDLDDTYCSEVLEQLQNRGLCEKSGSELGIVYTALSGTGQKPVTEILRRMGFGRLYEVAEQAKPDAEFSTVSVPNPEDDGAWVLARRRAVELSEGGEEIDLLLATDPDADRLGVCCRDKAGNFVRLSGNQVGVLLTDYLLGQRAASGRLPDGAMVVKSVVSTAMVDKLATARGVTVKNVPVGFKFIGEQIKLLEERHEEERFIFGFEESLGYLCGTYARDKDAVLAAALVTEAALYYKKQFAKSLLDVLGELYAELGFYADEQVAVTLSGRDGRRQIAEIMRRLRADERTELGGLQVESREYYAEGLRQVTVKGEARTEPMDFPRSDMLGVTLSGGRIAARPSGTEPKIRFYFCIAGEDEATARANFERVREEFFVGIKEFLL